MIQAAVAVLLIWLLDGFEAIVRVYVWTQWLFFTLATIALVMLRWSEPDLDRPYRVWLSVPVIFVAISVFMVFVLFFVSPATCSIAVIALLLGIPAWYLHQRLLRRSGSYASISDPNQITPLLIPNPQYVIGQTSEEYRTL